LAFENVIVIHILLFAYVNAYREMFLIQ